MKVHETPIKRKKAKRRSNSFIVLLCVLLLSCNYSNKNLLGKYVPSNLKGDTTSHKYVKELLLQENNCAKLIYLDTVMDGKWKEINVQELNYIKLQCNGELIELHVLKDSVWELHFVSNPTNFRGEYYDSLSFKKVQLDHLAR